MNRNLRTGLALGLVALLVAGVIVLLRTSDTINRTNVVGYFENSNGFYVGDDVRISGVQVGKVETVRLDGRIAKVDFTAQADHPVFTNTVAAVRYQTLIGQRYVELVQPATPDNRLVAAELERRWELAL